MKLITTLKPQALNLDTRITLGLALLYITSGISNVFSAQPVFAPLVFLDAFLLALLALVFAVLPPFRKTHVCFLAFAAFFTVDGLFATGFIRNQQLDLIILVLLLLSAVAAYVYTIINAVKAKILMLIPAVLAMGTLLLRSMEVPALVITATAALAAMLQLYVLARPDIMENTGTFAKRFYLLMTLMFFFDAVYQVFLHVNLT